MKISIITVAYNADRFIRDAIESVLGQNYINVEYIVVDGKSTDTTVNILESYIECFKKAGKSIRWISEEDQGIYDAMNKGIALASGRYIGLLNADDYYTNSKIISFVAGFLSRSPKDYIYGDVAFVNDTGERITRKYSSKIYNKKRLKYGIMPAHPTLFVKKDVFKKVGLYDPTFRIAGDFDFVARLASCDDLEYSYIPEVFIKMRRGGVSTRSYRSNLAITRELLEACYRNGIQTNRLLLTLRYLIKVRQFL